ncbi:hypothetical protein G5716_29605 [Bacillus pacificus]|nr:hypothetical protein [Bacillus pacificus]
MEIIEIQKLIDALHQSSIDELEYQTEDIKLRLKRNGKKMFSILKGKSRKLNLFQ